jgi:hypothetical protein
MATTRVASLANVALAGGVTSGVLWTALEYGDADGICVFTPSQTQTVTLQVSPDDTAGTALWFPLYQDMVLTTVAANLANAILISPPAFKQIRIVFGGALAGAQTIYGNKFWSS